MKYFYSTKQSLIYGQQNINLKIEICSLFCMDLPKEQDSNTHGSG